MQVERDSPCKVNFILNILGKRADGFHELETILQPIRCFDYLNVKRAGIGVELNCSDPALATDATNLVHRAAIAFKERAQITDGVQIYLEKRIPMAAGLGGGSSNAANTLLALYELFDHPISAPELEELATRLGSDVPFFLQNRPALGLGRGERVTSLEPFAAIAGMHIVLIHPGFGISTPWAYRALARFPAALKGEPGRAEALAKSLSVSGGLTEARGDFYNSLEAPALFKFPVLKLYQEFFLENGAEVSLMSGSGSTTFAIFASVARAENALERFGSEFGTSAWITLVPF